MKYKYKCVFISGFRGHRVKKINKYANLGWELVCIDGYKHYFKTEIKEDNKFKEKDLNSNYVYNNDNNNLEVWSKKRIQNQPKHWQLDLKNLIFNELLKFNQTGFLYGRYISIIKDKLDIENVLSNDIGYGAFNNMNLKGLCFERIFNNPPGSSIHPHFHHYLSYQLDNPFDDNDLFWIKSELLLKWNKLNVNLSSSIKPDYIWYNMKKSNLDILSNNKYKYYGLSLILKGKLNKQTLFTFLKPLIDGIISSFHNHTGKDITIISSKLDRKFDLNKKEIQKLLLDDKYAVLGKKNFVYLNKDSLQWSPSDDKLVQIYVEYHEEPNKSEWEVEGEIYGVEERY